MTTPNISKHIFISYARTDGKEHAARLDADLRAAGYQTWRDLRSLNEYQDFSAEIEINIQQASHVAVCITPSIEANPSSFVRREIIYAESKGKPIIPLVFPQTTVPILVNHLTWIPFFDQKTKQLDYESGFGNLLDRLKIDEHVKTRENNDPYRDYLIELYDQIVRYLNLTVFSLLSLQSNATPSAVESNSKNVLPITFWAMAGIENKVDDKRQFKYFNKAFEAYEGRMLLLGEPGGGKTTTLFAFARDAVARRLEDATLPLPILAPISTWNSQTQSQVADWLSDIIPVLKRENIERLINSRKVLLLLDGLDELGKEKEEEEEVPNTPTSVERHIAPKQTIYDPRLRFIAQIPTNTPVIITCRVKDYTEIKEKAKLNGAVTLRPLNDEQMQEYLRNLPDLWAALATDKKLRNVARTPLLLSLLRYAYQQASTEELQQLRNLQNSPGDLRDKIFETYVQQRYHYEKRRTESRSEKMPCTLEDIHNILGREVMSTSRNFQSHRNNNFRSSIIGTPQTGISQEEFLSLAEQLHLIVRPDLDHFRFAHLLLQDYFGFKYASLLINSSELSNRINAVRWMEQFDDIRAFKGVIAFLGDANKELRRSALAALGKISDVGAVKHLEKLLDDNNQYWVWENRVCDFAAQALRRIGTIEALDIVRKWQSKQMINE